MTVAPRPGDHLVFVGDLVDKGPDVIGVVRFVKELSEIGIQRVTLLKGNHEDSFLRFAHRKAQDAAGKTPKGAKPMQDPRGERQALLDVIGEAEIDFLRRSELFVRLPEHNTIVVHGGIMPSLREEELVTLVEMAELPRRDRERLETLLRCRHVDARGQMVPVGEERHADRARELGLATGVFDLLSSEAKEEIKDKFGRKALSKFVKTLPSVFWARIYDGRFGHAYFGHAAHYVDLDNPETFCYPHATAVDHGCVGGRLLTAAVLEPGKEREFVSIKSKFVYCEHEAED